MANGGEMTEVFVRRLSVRWSDVDANRHMRHSAYADFGAYARVALFDHHGFDMERMGELKLGPILFREELRYWREVKMFETVEIACRLLGLSPKAERWSIEHALHREDGELAATIVVDGAWLDLTTRKLCTPPEALMAVFTSLERAQRYADIALRS